MIGTLTLCHKANLGHAHSKFPCTILLLCTSVESPYSEAQYNDIHCYFISATPTSAILANMESQNLGIIPLSFSSWDAPIIVYDLPEP